MKLKGSLTIFFAMILIVTITLMFSMSECVRVYELKKTADAVSEEAINSAFSEYNFYLWVNYRILGMDMTYMKNTSGSEDLKDRLEGFARTNANPSGSLNFARLKDTSCDIKQYSLLTDEGASGVIYQGVKAVKENLVSNIIDGMTDEVSEVANASSEDVSGKVVDGIGSLADAKEEYEKKKNEDKNDGDPNTDCLDEPPGEVDDNPLDDFATIQSMVAGGLLKTLIPDMDSVSQMTISDENCPSKRALNCGLNPKSNGISIVDKTLYTQYLTEYFSRYTQTRVHAGLQYETEYVIAGKNSDKENLAKVAEKILLIREASNYATILKNSSMRNQAKTIATILAGFSGNPVVIEAVELAIIGAWAYVESILDVRLLLKGGKVPLVKDSTNWTSDVNHLSYFLDVNKTAKESETGIDYEGYLKGFLLLESTETLGLRSCDIFEDALSHVEGNENAKIDNMIYTLSADFTYNTKSLFINVANISEKNSSMFTFKRTKEISY